MPILLIGMGIARVPFGQATRQLEYLANLWDHARELYVAAIVADPLYLTDENTPTC